MSITQNRFQLALRQLEGSQWEHFERLCSAFLATEFPSLRTTASPGGDRGRDAELFSYSGVPHVLFQFTLRKDWRLKIQETLKKTAKEFTAANQIIFITNQTIGAMGDGLKAQAVTEGRNLDIRDISWFLERMNSDDARRAAAEDLSRVVVDPYLANSGVLTNAPGLRGQEARTALVYLEMQSRDEIASKGLTKLSFEALVKCVLRGTSPSARKTRDQICADINALLPQHTPQQLQPFINASLSRLSKGSIKHWQKEDEFHLSFEEEEATKNRVTHLAILNDAFKEDIEEMLQREPSLLTNQYASTIVAIRTILEIYFFRLGEEFAQCLTKDTDLPLHSDMIRDIAIENAPAGFVFPGRTWSDFLSALCRQLVTTPSEATTELLRLLSTSYTLFAFLSEVPDVQKATKKLFEHGTIWLDTSALLPVVAENVFPEDMRPFTDMMKQLSRSGTKLVYTEGVLEEIERHLNLCATYVRSSDWRGRVPFVCSRYVEAGRSLLGFSSWLETLIGDHRPLDDLADFLDDVAQISVSDLPSFEALDDDVVAAVNTYWQWVQEERRGYEEGFSSTAYRLAVHDAENYLAVLAQRRLQRGGSALGYSSWLLTLDSAAWLVLGQMDADVQKSIRHSPIVSLDFLLRYLAFGPRRDRIDTTGKGFSRIFTASVYETIPADLIEVAEQVRQRNGGLSERIILRRIRDELDKQKMAAGAAQRAGLSRAGDAYVKSL